MMILVWEFWKGFNSYYKFLIMKLNPENLLGSQTRDLFFFFSGGSKVSLLPFKLEPCVDSCIVGMDTYSIRPHYEMDALKNLIDRRFAMTLGVKP
jgi:hypothetical protein